MQLQSFNNITAVKLKFRQDQGVFVRLLDSNCVQSQLKNLVYDM